MTRTPLSRSKGHQAALLTAAFTHQAAVAMSVGKYSPWEPTVTFQSADGANRRRRGAGHIVAAARIQLVSVFNAGWLHFVILLH